MTDRLTEHRIQELIIQVKQLCDIITEQAEILQTLNQRVAVLETVAVLKRKDTTALVKEWAGINEKTDND